MLSKKDKKGAKVLEVKDLTQGQQAKKT